MGTIIAKIRNSEPPGRFLEFNKKSNSWIDIGDIRTKKKTAQAIREFTKNRDGRYDQAYVSMEQKQRNCQKETGVSKEPEMVNKLEIMSDSTPLHYCKSKNL